jgi:hypothetical protein
MEQFTGSPSRELAGRGAVQNGKAGRSGQTFGPKSPETAIPQTGQPGMISLPSKEGLSAMDMKIYLR